MNMHSFSSSRHNDKSKNKSGSTTALAAVAFQDHLLRSIGPLSLSTAVPRLGAAPTARPRKLSQSRKEVRPVVDTGRAKLKVEKQKPAPAEYKEFVLDAKPPPKTLAQKMGLVECSNELLTEEEWQLAKLKSNARDDSRQPCVICKEDFGTGQQVLLSCTHVFHRDCLEAFERFTGKKSCPMCRKEQYQTRVIHEGMKSHRITCATRIQAIWRGYVTRCWYKKLRETVPPNDPTLRRKFYEKKLHDITDRMVRSCDYDVNSFLREMDRSMEQSRDVFRHFDEAIRGINEEEWERIQLQAVERGNKDCPICLTALEEQGLVAEERRNTSINMRTKSGAKNKTNSDKQKTGYNQKPENGSKDSTLHFQDKGDNLLDKHSRPGRERVLLSCTHVFHKKCLEAFEDFTLDGREFVCPVCRSLYQKKIIGD